MCSYGGVPTCSMVPTCSPGSLSPYGIVGGVNPACINQIPPAEVVIQPPPVVVTIPGPILTASCEPISVGGHTPCAPGLGSRRCYPRRLPSNPCNPCGPC